MTLRQAGLELARFALAEGHALVRQSSARRARISSDESMPTMGASATRSARMR